ncbi:hypothetical protein XcvCFBP7111P_24535 (plasmid) [Xanthomonas citri pv. vignicola]|uniref:Secreted protein n=1 Tax=Xanthomonas citri pv. vignicola TaxID=473426 RepID=A0AB33CML9_XANCI|nr:hypothetical protein XcvCFBP7111P_24535 [Xanthomonas citri pv. vignicola]
MKRKATLGVSVSMLAPTSYAPTVATSSHRPPPKPATMNCAPWMVQATAMMVSPTFFIWATCDRLLPAISCVS